MAQDSASYGSVPLLLYDDSYGSADVYHASGFLAPDPFTYLERDGEGVILTNALEAGRARKESRATAVRDVDEFGYQQLVGAGATHEAAIAEVVRRFLREAGVGRARVPSTFPLFLADVLRAGGIVLELALDLGERRRRKRDEEVAAIETAQRATEHAFSIAVDALRAADVAKDGTLVLEGIKLTAERLRSMVEVALLRSGCAADSTILAPGPQGADPHLIGTGPYRVGEAVIMDIYPRDKRTRYYADMTRTVCRGEPPPAIVDMYEAVRRAQEEGIVAVRPGVTGRAVHERVQDVLFAAGYATLREGQRREGTAAFIHSTGHGVGLEIHEEPRLGPSGHQPLDVGDVVTVEPGVYLAGVGGVRIEDMVVVTESGCRNLTRAPKGLRID